MTLAIAGNVLLRCVITFYCWLISTGNCTLVKGSELKRVVVFCFHGQHAITSSYRSTFAVWDVVRDACLSGGGRLYPLPLSHLSSQITTHLSPFYIKCPLGMELPATPSQNPSDFCMVTIEVACPPASLCDCCPSCLLSGPVWKSQACRGTFFSGWQSGAWVGLFESIHRVHLCLGCQLSQVEPKYKYRQCMKND